MSFRHFKSLLFKSTQIDVQIEREQKSPWPDWIRLLKLKKLRLMIKDRIQRIVLERSNGQYEIAHEHQPISVRTKWRRS